MLKHKVELNEKEMYYYSLDNVGGIEYDEKCIVNDVADRVGYPDCAYGIYEAKIIEENGIFYATWISGSSAD